MQRKPTPEQMDQALLTSKKLRESEDPDCLGHALLYLYERNQHLERIYESVHHYLHSGQAPREHSVLLRTMEAAEKALHPHEDGEAVFPGA